MDDRLLKQMQQQHEPDRQKALLRLAAEKLDKTQQSKLHALLSDPDAVQSLLQSERAQELLRQIQTNTLHKHKH